MTLILLAISAAVALCVLAYTFAIYAMPFMVGMTVAQYAYAAEAGFIMSGLAGLASAILSAALVVAVVALAKHMALRLLALAIFAVPAAIAGYSLVFGVTHNVIESAILLHTMCGIAGLFIAVGAVTNLSALVSGPATR